MKQDRTTPRPLSIYLFGLRGRSEPKMPGESKRRSRILGASSEYIEKSALPFSQASKRTSGGLRRPLNRYTHHAAAGFSLGTI